MIDSLLSSDIKTELAANGYVDTPVKRTEDADGFFLRGQAVGRDQAVHTAADIPVSAYRRSEAWRGFVGVQTNTGIFFKIGKVVLGPGDATTTRSSVGARSGSRFPRAEPLGSRSRATRSGRLPCDPAGGREHLVKGHVRSPSSGRPPAPPR